MGTSASQNGFTGALTPVMSGAEMLQDVFEYAVAYLPGRFLERDPLAACDIRELQIEFHKRQCHLRTDLGTAPVAKLQRLWDWARPGAFSTSFSTTSTKDEWLPSDCIIYTSTLMANEEEKIDIDIAQ